LFVYVYMKVFFYVHESALSRMIYFLHNVFHFSITVRVVYDMCCES
jgi:hypothetical protein